MGHSFFFKIFFFYVDHFLKVFIEFVTILLLSYGLVFDPETCGILASWSGIETTPPTLEDEGLTTGPPGKSQRPFLMRSKEIPCRRFWRMERNLGSGPLEQTVFLAFPVAICPPLPSTSSPTCPTQVLIIDFIQGMKQDWPVFIFISDWSTNRQETQFYQ